eukprot:scaffold14899_cov63-Phaeocystis_antarctica.AAC.2
MGALIVPERAAGLGRMVEHHVVVVVTEEQEEVRAVRAGMAHACTWSYGDAVWLCAGVNRRARSFKMLWA